MRTLRRSPLFSAVVLAGASLTSAGACGSTESVPGSADAASGPGTGADATTRDAALPTTDAADANEPKDAACPPDSEIPTPPCALIK